MITENVKNAGTRLDEDIFKEELKLRMLELKARRLEAEVKVNISYTNRRFAILVLIPISLIGIGAGVFLVLYGLRILSEERTLERNFCMFFAGMLITISVPIFFMALKVYFTRNYITRNYSILAPPSES